jgi:D-alanyl-D-alanine carboxypeptidase
MRSPLPLTLLFAAAGAAQDSRPATGTTTVQAVEAAFQAHLLALHEQRRFPGACAAFTLPDGSDGAVAVGADAAGVPLTAASRMMTGSIGKTYVAAVALQLVHEGRLALDGKVAEVLGEHDWYARVPNAGAITLRQLLDHTSGIPEHVWKKPFQEAVTKAGDRALTPVECVGYVLGDAPVAAPGARWSYADTNYVLVGLCVEAVTGKPFFDVLRARVLEPLALEDTIVNDRRDLPGLACGMASGIGFHRGRAVEDGRYFTNPAFEYCGGGLSSTARDLARWLRALFAGDVVPAGLRAAHRAGVPAARGVAERYGLGCFVTSSPHGPAFGHSGVMPGYLAYALWYPELQVAVAVQFPTDDARAVGNQKRLVDELAGLVRGR